MIRAVESKSDIRKAILYTIQSPFFKVTGGELFKLNGWFYLMYGQVYDQPYSVGVSGNYTAVSYTHLYSGHQEICL